MVVISASICNKNGKILIARQFIPITKIKLEEYIANFPKLIDQSSGKQSNFIETEQIRYVYQPMEKLFLVLITLKNSNIIEDIEVIRQMQQVVVTQCQTQSVDEKTVNKKAFDLILCFDDIISSGYRESVTVSQIESYIEMDSTDEKVHRKQQMLKEAEMKDNAKIQAREIAKKRLDPNFKRDQMQAISSTDYETQPATSLSEIENKGSSSSNNQLKNYAQKDNNLNSFQKMLAEQEMKGVAKKAPKKGMQLGKQKQKTNQLMQELEKQQIIVKEEINDNKESLAEQQQVQEYNPLTENILMEVDEKVTCQVNKDGDIEKFELKGTVYLTLTDNKKSHAKVPLQFFDFKGLTFKVHPEIDKQEWNKNKMIQSKNSSSEDYSVEGISTQTKLDVLRYRYTSKSETDLPFTINVFNSKKQGKNVITMEVEYNKNQENLRYKKLDRVTIGLNMGDAGSQVDIELLKQNVNIEQDNANNILLWHVANIHDEESAVLSFSSKNLNFDDMFPLDVRFHEDYSLIDLQISNQSPPINLSSQEEMSIKFSTNLQTEGYKVSID